MFGPWAVDGDIYMSPSEQQWKQSNVILHEYGHFLHCMVLGDSRSIENITAYWNEIRRDPQGFIGKLIAQFHEGIAEYFAFSLSGRFGYTGAELLNIEENWSPYFFRATSNSTLLLPGNYLLDVLYQSDSTIASITSILHDLHDSEADSHPAVSYAGVTDVVSSGFMGGNINPLIASLPARPTIDDLYQTAQALYAPRFDVGWNHVYFRKSGSFSYDISRWVIE